jgi:ribosome-associated protein
LEIARSIIDTLEEHKGEDILLLEIQEISSIADYFIIATATSSRMIDSLSKAVIEKSKQSFDIIPKHEGSITDGWQVVDMGDIVVHLFSEEQREYYRLEQLWEEGKVLVRLH